ncbi:MAG: phosphohistidine phosphatase SixA [Phycisphaerae bacterium]|nr:phosphohistidine phosphatase SixA [Phycisphaerae bacterium]
MKSLFLIRHGKAGSRSEYARDAERPLTEEGAHEAALCGRGLAKIAAIDVMFTSPLIRARQTAELFAQGFTPQPTISVIDELAPVNSPARLLKIVNAAGAESVALVGHEPDMSSLTSWLLTGQGIVAVEFKKAMVCRIDFEGEAAAGEGTLAWLIPAKVMRTTGK